MSYGFYICASAGLILLQTSVFPCLPPVFRPYDLLIPLVLYLGMSCPMPESLVTLLLSGLFMDCLSACPFGLHMTTYLWLFIGVRWGIMFWHMRNAILMSVMVMVGILWENTLFMGGGIGLGKDGGGEMLHLLAWQGGWALVTGPFLILLFRRLRRSQDPGAVSP